MSRCWGADSLEPLDGLVADSVLLVRGLIEYGRLGLMSSFFEARIARQQSVASNYIWAFEAAGHVHQFAHRYWLVQEPLIQWSQELQGCGAFQSGTMDQGDVNLALNACLAGLLPHFRQLLARAKAIPDARYSQLLLGLAGQLPPFPSDQPERSMPLWVESEQVCRPFRAPVRSFLDPIFRREGFLSQKEFDAPAETASADDLAKRTWLTAMHEALASRLCVITLFEYDGLPLGFYLDLAKQAMDEANHAQIFLECAARILQEDALPNEGHWDRAIETFLERDAVLSVPAEGDFYPSIAAGDLRTRLTWMQIDTEGPGVGELEHLLANPFVQCRPYLAAALEYVIQDEITHAKFGRRWAKHIELDEDQLTHEEARLMRGLLLTESVAVAKGCSLAKVVMDVDALAGQVD